MRGSLIRQFWTCVVAALAGFCCAAAQELPQTSRAGGGEGKREGPRVIEQLEPQQQAEHGTRSAMGWDQILYESLWLHHQGKHREVFDLVDKAIRSREPGPEVHRCLAMMRRAFIDFTKTPEPVQPWKGEAKTYIDRLEAKEEKDIGDIIVLCVLKPLGKSRQWATEPLLDRIIESDSAWRDWAYWEKARVVAFKSGPSTETWGLVPTKIGDIEYPTCSAQVPSIAIRLRAANAFLIDNAGTYMREAFAEDILWAQLWHAQWSISDLLERKQILGNSLTEEGAQSLNAALKNVREVRTSATTWAILQRELDDRLWGDFYYDIRGFYVRYFRAVVEDKGKDALPPEIYKAVIALPDTEKPGEKE